MRYILILSILISLNIYANDSSAVNKKEEIKKAYFAGGCFWCMESPFEKHKGVKEVYSGYMGGTKVNPTYSEVSSGTTGHTEAIEVNYDPKIISYEKLLDIFWRQIDPTDNQGQFVDRGTQYRPGIYYSDDKEKELALNSKREHINKKTFPKPIVLEIISATKFYKAEEYHQNYYKKNPIRYHFYRSRSGRDTYLEKIWNSK